MILRPVVDEEVAIILDRTGINVKGYRHVLPSNNLRHILLEHGVGNEQDKNQVPLTEADLALIPDVINSPEAIEKGTPTKQGMPSILYEKTDASGTTTVVEVVSSSKKKLIVKTMWRKPPDIDHASDTDRVYTSKTGAGQTSSTVTNSIPQPGELFQPATRTKINLPLETETNPFDGQYYPDYEAAAKAVLDQYGRSLALEREDGKQAIIIHPSRLAIQRDRDLSSSSVELIKAAFQQKVEKLVKLRSAYLS